MHHNYLIISAVLSLYKKEKERENGFLVGAKLKSISPFNLFVTSINPKFPYFIIFWFIGEMTVRSLSYIILSDSKYVYDIFLN